jgi:tRNA(Ile)-lysidine synthase
MTDVLVGLSAELGLSVTVASVDHGLRPESAHEVELVRGLAAGWGVPFHGLRLQLSKGSGVQARAREARYSALHALRAEVGADWLAVGHTRDDQAETVLARVLRGSGVRGLRGIWPERPDGVVRPLIDCARADVLAYLRARSEVHDGDARNVLVAVTDPSNDDPVYERVRLRHELLPALRAEDADVVKHLAELADDARDLVELAEHAGAALLRGALTAGTSSGSQAARGRVLRVGPLRAAPRAARLEALRQLLASAGASQRGSRRAHLVDLERAVMGGEGAHVLVGRGVSYRRVGTELHELTGSLGRDNDSGGLHPGSEETTKLYV